jgi:CRISPR-associated protein Cmr6
MPPSPKNSMYSGTKLVDALTAQHEKRSKSGLFKSGEFVLDWRSKIGSFPHPDNETLVSAGEPCGSWKTVTVTKREKDNNGKWQDRKYQSRPEDKRNLDHNLESLAILPLNGYVPAASIRGIVRAWVSEHPDLVVVMKDLLGYQDGSKIIAGKIEFLDAFPTKATRLTLDIANPQQEFQVFHTGSASPLSLYTLGNGREEIKIKVAIRGCRKATPDDVNTVWEWVQQALSSHGIGSRTASGYGALKAPESYVPSVDLPKLKDGYSSKTLDFTLYSQGSAGPNPKTPELRPTHWRGWLRSWLLRFLLGVMSESNARSTLDELLGTLSKQGCVRSQIRIDKIVSSENTPKFYKWTGSLTISAPTNILDEIILPIIKIATRVGGVGRGWRRPLHRFILETKYSNADTARGCHVELTRSRDDIVTNSIIAKADLGGNDLALIYEDWKKSVQKHWQHLYYQPTSNINAEVFSPNTCAVYLVPAPNRNPIDPKSLKWIPGETTDTRGKGMELIYQLTYKRKYNVGGNLSSCSWVSIKRVNGAKPEDPFQEIVCIFMSKMDSSTDKKYAKRDDKPLLRSQFLADLANIPGAIHLFGRKPT